MNCPMCNKEATLYAEVKPGGRIGVFCRNCKKGYYTTNPDDGWEAMDYNFSPLKLSEIEDLRALHNIDIEEEILVLAEKEFEMFITGVHKIWK